MVCRHNSSICGVHCDNPIALYSATFNDKIKNTFIKTQWTDRRRYRFDILQTVFHHAINQIYQQKSTPRSIGVIYYCWIASNAWSNILRSGKNRPTSGMYSAENWHILYLRLKQWCCFVSTLFRRRRF